MDEDTDMEPACNRCGRQDFSVGMCAIASPMELSKPMGLCDTCHHERMLPTGLLDPPGMDRFGLERFVIAQADTYDDALAELRAGTKQGHWMWFIFPQVAGLGHSSMSQRYAIRSMFEAAAYLRHPVLGPRLEECTTAVMRSYPASAVDVFGDVDALKFRSSMTLFSMTYGGSGNYKDILELHWFDGPDPRSVEIIEGWWAADD